MRKNINQAFMVLCYECWYGPDSAIVDPTNKNMIGMIYATNALERDEYCLGYIGNKTTEEAAHSQFLHLHLMRKMQKVFKLTQDGKIKKSDRLSRKHLMQAVIQLQSSTTP